MTHFQLPSYTFPVVKSQMLSGELHFKVVVRLLQNVCQTLEKLELIEHRLVYDELFDIKSETKLLFDAVQVNFTQLTSINLDCLHLPVEPYENLLISYGPKLRFVCFGADCTRLDVELQCLSRIVEYSHDVLNVTFRRAFQ